MQFLHGESPVGQSMWLFTNMHIIYQHLPVNGRSTLFFFSYMKLSKGFEKFLTIKRNEANFPQLTLFLRFPSMAAHMQTRQIPFESWNKSFIRNNILLIIYFYNYKKFKVYIDFHFVFWFVFLVLALKLLNYVRDGRFFFNIWWRYFASLRNFVLILFWGAEYRLSIQI